MRRSSLFVVAVAALFVGLAGVACSKKETREAKASDVDVSASDAASGDVKTEHDKARERMAEKARARQAARKAAKEAREAKAKAAAGEGEPSDAAKPTPEGVDAAAGVPAGTPAPVTPDEAAAARAEAAAAPVAPSDATGVALVTRPMAPLPPPPVPNTALAPTPPPAAPAPPATNSVEIVVRDDAPLDLSKLVTLADVQKVMKKTPLKQSEPLAGSLPARDYNGVRFFAPQNETLGVAVQVWRFPTSIDARRRYDLFSGRYPAAEKTDAVATQGFFAQAGDVLYLGFLDQAKKTVAVVSCSEDACDMKDLYVLARDLQKKF